MPYLGPATPENPDWLNCPHCVQTFLHLYDTYYTFYYNLYVTIRLVQLELRNED